LRLVKFIGFIETKCVYLKRRKVGSLQNFNLVLSRKWCWRLRSEKDEFWCHLSAHKHGLLNREAVRDSITNLIWWKYIFSSMRGDEISEGRWFVYNVINKIGNGNKTLFSHESWLDREVIKNHFSM